MKSEKKSYAIFLEPQLPSGFPDAVIAEYDFEQLLHWNEARCKLTESDIKLLCYMLRVKNTSSTNMVLQLGIAKGCLLDSLEHLWDANLIARKDGLWQLNDNVRQKMLVKQLTSIEAKINDWKTVFEQAQMNISFANYSYVLTPAKKPTVKIQNYAQEIGVGIYSYSNHKISKIITPHRTTLGLFGCASLMLNEWIGRYLFLR